MDNWRHLTEWHLHLIDDYELDHCDNDWANKKRRHNHDRWRQHKVEDKCRECEEANVLWRSRASLYTLNNDSAYSVSRRPRHDHSPTVLCVVTLLSLLPASDVDDDGVYMFACLLACLFACLFACLTDWLDWWLALLCLACFLPCLMNDHTLEIDRFFIIRFTRSLLVRLTRLIRSQSIIHNKNVGVAIVCYPPGTILNVKSGWGRTQHYGSIWIDFYSRIRRMRRTQ